MPNFTFYTNVEGSKVTSEFLQETSNILCKELGKPLQFIQVLVLPDQKMIMAGTAEPCGTGTLGCIGKLGIEENKKYTSVLMDHIETHLGISKERMYINFVDLKREEVGWNGTTFYKG